jgi:hypothetical protein
MSLKTGNSKGWEAALERASKALANNKLQASRLRSAILFFKEKIEKDAPWPGVEDAGTVKKSVPA